MSTKVEQPYLQRLLKLGWDSLLFFNEHPAYFFPATQIDVTWFPEGAGGDIEELRQGKAARSYPRSYPRSTGYALGDAGRNESVRNNGRAWAER